MEENSIYKAEGGFLFYPLMDLNFQGDGFVNLPLYLSIPMV